MQKQHAIERSFLGPRTLELSEKTAPKFPSSRYFQIHFEALTEQLQQTQNSLALLQRQMQDMEQRLLNNGLNQDSV